MQAIPDISSAMINQLMASQPHWLGIVARHAYKLFWLLAIIDFTWTAVQMVLEQQSMEQWGASLVRSIIARGVLYALLLNGPQWCNAIMLSLQQIGQEAAGVQALSPGDVLFRGPKIAAALFSASTAGGFMNAVAAAPLALACGILIVLAFLMLSVNLVMALLSFYLMGGAQIFLGFGGSHWTVPWVERYIALAVGIGVKLMLHYFLIGTAMGLSANWDKIAMTISQSAQPARDSLSMMGAALLLSISCWMLPKIFSDYLGGAPSLTGGDMLSFGAMLAMGAVGGKMAISNMASSMSNMVSSMGGGGAAAAGAAGGGSGPGGGGAGGIGASLPQSVPAPKAGGGGSNGATAKGVAIGMARSLGRDGSHTSSPPRMPIDH